MNAPIAVPVTAAPWRIRVLHDGQLHDVAGFRASGAHAGLKKIRRDVALIATDRPAAAAGVFTRNAIVAAPVVVTRDAIRSGRARAIVCNSGNANACTGEQGLRDARRMGELAAQLVGCDPDEVLVASTGVIGKLLPMDKVEAGIRQAAVNLDANEAGAAAEAIMTTDNAPKQIVVEVRVGDRSFRLGGIAKGAGMIEPNMATMLAFLATDLEADPADLDAALRASVEPTYNSISVDHDSSTNDMVLALANGVSGMRLGVDVPTEAFQAALDQVNLHLAKLIARDGEGATKLVTCTVRGARTPEEAKKAAKAVINSPLVKCAVHGSDPNWGRVLAALGYSGAALDPARIRLRLGNANQQVTVLDNGEPLAFDPTAAHQLMMHDDVHIVADLGTGDASWTTYGCDLTREYVDFNAHYTT